EALDFAAGKFFNLLKRASVEEREALEGTADECTFGFGRGLIGATAELDDLGNHVFGRKEFFGRGIDQREERVFVCGEFGESAVIEFLPFTRPLSFAFLDEP